LSDEHLQIVLKYFEGTSRLTPRQWRLALESFDLLGKAHLVVARRRLSFRQAYDRYVDRHFADQFLMDLTRLKNLGAEADELERKTTRKVLVVLETEGFYDEAVHNSEYFAAYCLYWWNVPSPGDTDLN
jgi:hypothetical protein